MKRPLVGVTLAFICGILIARPLKIPYLYLYFATGLFLLLTLLSWRKKLLSHLFLLLSILSIGCTLYQISYLTGPAHIVNFIENNEEKGADSGIFLEGTVIRDPLISVASYGTQTTSLILNARTLSCGNKRYGVKGIVRTTIYNPGRRFSYGDDLILFGKLSRPRGPGNPGQFDWRRYLARQRIYALLTVKDGGDVVLLRGDQGSPIVKWALKVKHRAKSIITKTLPKPQSDILAAILLGERQDLPLELKDRFIQTGTMHILATEYTKKPGYRVSCNPTL